MRRNRSSKSTQPTKPIKSRSRPTDNSSNAVLGGVNLGELKRLIRLVQRTGIGELEVRSGVRTVRISAHGVGVAPMVAPLPGTGREGDNPRESSVPSAAPAKSDSLLAITSPMVGTFYRAPAPDADSYVEAGDSVEVGQTVCIIEAMKLMNEIESEVRGRIAKVLVENAQPVEFGQKLFLVEPL